MGETFVDAAKFYEFGYFGFAKERFGHWDGFLFYWRDFSRFFILSSRRARFWEIYSRRSMRAAKATDIFICISNCADVVAAHQTENTSWPITMTAREIKW
jgi:hypothetical protein